MTISGAALADATPMQVIDDRKAITKGFNIIYEARDNDLVENQRQGRTQARGDIASVMARARVRHERVFCLLKAALAGQNSRGLS